jgi:hypothetical protein
MSIRVAGGLVLLLSMSGLSIDAQRVEARVVVSVADHFTHRPRTLTLEDIRSVGPSMRIAKVEPLEGDRELFRLIDDGSSFDFGDKLQDLRRFVNMQPASTAIGVAYITGGGARDRRDHQRH